ncbi:type II toxin-antitoxin system HicA family toxin [Methanoregula sp.]|uniref:type II toxin-antitoxin system HicA family toxin n=1 Tax=Methanoregula sp. TaxID=2052170 RepID=UPI003C774E38
MTSLHNSKGKDAVRAFANSGGKIRPGKGDHVNIKMPGGQLITIPVSGEVKIDLLKAAIKKAGLTDEEFEKLL